MYGIYLKCETCGATVGGEEVTPREQGVPTLTRWQGRELRDRAAQRGWTHSRPDSDFCPACSPSTAKPSQFSET